jgi:hypothetical protein
MGIGKSKAVKDAPKVDINDLLYEAVLKNNFERVQALLGEGARPDNSIGTQTGYTAYHAVQTVEMLDYICDSRGMDAPDEMVDNFGHTPLHLAARRGLINVALSLVEHGCDVNAQNQAQRTPIQLAKTYGQVEVYLVLEQVASGVCFCGSSSDDMLVSFMLAYPNMPIIDELNVKVEGNAEIRRQHKQKIANSERQKTFTFERLQARGAEAKEAREIYGDGGKREGLDSEHEVLKRALAENLRVEDSDDEGDPVEGLEDLSGLKEAIKFRQLAHHFRAGKCSSRRVKCSRCEKVTTIKDMEDHLNREDQCGDANVLCPEGCGKKFAKSDIELHRQICTYRKEYLCPKGCEKLLYRNMDDVQHLNFHCPMRKKRCKHCKKWMQARDLNWHINNECANRRVKCGVQNCDTWFQSKTQKNHLVRHEETHLNKLAQDWTPYELAFWLYRKFEFFRPADLEYYCKNIVANRIEGYMIVECEPGKLDSLLEKQVGIVNVNARGTVLQALGIGLQQGVKAGVFLDAAVRREVISDLKQTIRRPSHSEHMVEKILSHNNAARSAGKRGGNRLQARAYRVHKIV